MVGTEKRERNTKTRKKINTAFDKQTMVENYKESGWDKGVYKNKTPRKGGRDNVDREITV